MLGTMLMVFMFKQKINAENMFDPKTLHTLSVTPDTCTSKIFRSRTEAYKSVLFFLMCLMNNDKNILTHRLYQRFRHKKKKTEKNRPEYLFLEAEIIFQFINRPILCELFHFDV